MRLKNSDVVVAFAIVLLNGVELLLPSTLLWVSVLLALPLIFFVPGYMLTAVLTHTRRLDIFHRLALSLGLSLTLDILGGFLLNVLPMGLRMQSWIVLLSCLTLVFALAVLYLRRGMVYVSEREDHVVQRREPRTPTTHFIFWTRVRDGFVFALAITLVILSLMYATRSVAEGPHVGFTQLWMLPPSHKAQTCVVNVGIHSFENGPVTYHASITMNSAQTMSWPTLTLAPNQLWERSVAVTPTTAKNMFVEMRLYRNDKPTVMYREVHMTLTVLNKQQKTFYCEV